MGNPLRIFNLSFSILNWGNFDDRISDLEVVVMLCERALTPSDMYTHVWSLLRGDPLQIFILHFPCWNWKKISMTWSIRLGYQACPSPIPKWYAHVWTHKKRDSLAIFLFCILQSRIKRILTRGFARGRGWSGWCSKRRCVQPLPLPNPTDVYFLHLSCREVLNKTSILTVVGGSAGVSLS